VRGKILLRKSQQREKGGLLFSWMGSKAVRSEDLKLKPILFRFRRNRKFTKKGGDIDEEARVRFDSIHLWIGYISECNGWDTNPDWRAVTGRLRGARGLGMDRRRMGFHGEW
jgi:hypothetical protein